MRWWLLALCACNRVLGLGEVAVTDAGFYDGLPDAQPHCPAYGVVPRFSPLFHQVLDQHCTYYTTALDGTALAQCLTAPAQGSVDAELGPASGLPVSGLYYNLRIAPEADVAYFDYTDPNTYAFSSHEFKRAGSTWTEIATLPMTGYVAGSTPSLGPQRHMLFAGATSLTEWVQNAAGTWSQVHSIDVGYTALHPWLSPDGLYAIVTVYDAGGNLALLYLDRASIDAAFDPPVALPTLPPTLDMFVTADCTRAYFSGVDSIFYAIQI